MALAKDVEASKKFDGQRFRLRGVPLSDSSSDIDYQQSAQTCDNLLDQTAFSHKFSGEISAISELEEFMREADYYINCLYTYRSYSRPLPMIPADLDENAKKPLYKESFDIVKPQIDKIKGLMEFNDRMIKSFTKNLRLLVYPYEKKEPLWIDHIRTLIKVLDKFVILDSLKDIKGQMKNDFSHYKRSFTFIRGILQNSGELMAEITAIYNFLNDPQRPYHIILYLLKEDVKQVPHREELLGILIDQALEDLKEHAYCTPEEKFCYYRCFLACLYLVDDGHSNINVFKSKVISIKDIRSYIKKAPILPLYMDCKINALLFLALCEHWQQNMEGDWISKKHHALYNLVNHRARIQEQYIQYTADFVTLLHEIKCVHKEESTPVDLQKKAFHVVLSGFKLLGDWTVLVKDQIAYKADHPIAETEYKLLGGRGGDSQVYEQITRFNYDNNLKYALVETIGLIKGLANLLLENENVVRGMIAAYIHETLQDFSHNGLLMPLFRSFKRKKLDLQDTLLSMRLVISDCFDINTLRQDFQKSKEKEIKKLAEHKWPKREVFPTKTQVILLRRLMFHIFSSDASGMKGGFLTEKDLKKVEVEQFTTIWKMIQYVDYVANYSITVKKCTDLSDLWYREFYLNLTNCIQFPISMSLPWMLTDFAMNTPSLAPNVFFPLSIYNDCAEVALNIFRQQYLFDEIEAEVNLVFDQLIFTLYRKIFDYYKNKAAQIVLDKPFQRRMEALRNKLGHQMKLNYARYTPIFQQRSVHILGRTVDIASLLTEQLNLYIRENLEAIITRYEASTITSVMEIEHLLMTLRLTVTMLRKDLPGIDPFEDVLLEVNEDATLGSFRGRIFLATYNAIFSDLLRTYQFNQLTLRFVSLERPKAAKRIDNTFLWGSRFTQIYQQIFKVTRGFFGVEHLHAIVQIMGIENMPLLVDEVVKTCAHVIIRDISPYVSEILGALDPMRQQAPHYGVLGVYGYYSLVLQFIKSYPALREGVFTLLREAGNALCLVQLLDMVLTHESFYNHQMEAFYLGVEPAVMPDEAKENKEDIVYSSGAAIMSKPEKSPFILILEKTLSNLKNDKNLGIYLKKEHGLIDACIQTAIKREKYLTTNSGGWLFSATLDYLFQKLETTGLLKEWKGAEPKNGIIEHENPKDFARFWSVATFIFLVPDFAPVNTDDQQQQQQQETVNDSNQTYFGDGWLWAGTTILYLIGLQSRYRLFDPTIYIDKLQRLYPVDLDSKKKKKKKDKENDAKTEAYKPFVKGLLEAWQEMEPNVDLINCVLRAHYQPLVAPITKFTPRWEE